MAESSDVGAATVSIPRDCWLRADSATPAPMIDDTNPAPPSSIPSYNQRLSRSSQDEIQKVREQQRRDSESEDS
jgi:hypothetical protein